MPVFIFAIDNNNNIITPQLYPYGNYNIFTLLIIDGGGAILH